MRRVFLSLALLLGVGMTASPFAQNRVGWDYEVLTHFKVCIDAQPCLPQVGPTVRELEIGPLTDGQHTIRVESCSVLGCSSQSSTITCSAGSCSGGTTGNPIPLPAPVTNIRFTGTGGGQNPVAITRQTPSGTQWGKDYTGGGSTTIATGTFPHTSGDDIIGVARNYDPAGTHTLSSASDIAGNTYIVGPSIRDSSSGTRVTIIYSLGAPNANANNVITATFAASTQYRSVMIDRFNGLSGGSLGVGSGLPASGVSTPPATVVSTNSFNTVEAEELVFVGFSVADTFPTWTLESGYLQGTEDDFRTTSMAYRITSSALTSEVIDVTAADRTASKVVIAISFKAAAGGGGGAIASLAGFAYRQHRR